MGKNRVLYVTDLDGTLLNSNDKISKFSLDTINGLVEQGMLFTYATARSLVSASVVAKGLSAHIPVIAYNGCLIIRPENGEILHRVSFSNKERENARKHIQENGISPFVYSYIDGVERVSWRPDKENEGGRRYLSKRIGDKRLRPVQTEEELYEGEIFYYTCIGEQEQLLPLYEKIKPDERYHCTLQQELYRPEYWCELMPAQATKAHAIEKLKEILSCEKVVSFGDAINDIPMFAISDECYAVENAVPKLKEHATGIIESNDSDGVAKWLKRHAL
ncbi:MAG: HAD family hydrolase [Lachnospiraceae bacterium]